MRCEIQRAHALVADVRQIGALAVAGATSGREIGCNTERERERERGEFDETEIRGTWRASKGFVADDRGIREPRQVHIANHRGTRNYREMPIHCDRDRVRFPIVPDSNGI